MMIPLAIATGLLAVLDDNNEDFEELFHRAMLLGDRQILFSRMTANQESDLIAEIQLRVSTCPSDEEPFWERALHLFAPEHFVEECDSDGPIWQIVHRWTNSALDNYRSREEAEQKCQEYNERSRK